MLWVTRMSLFPYIRQRFFKIVCNRPTANLTAEIFHSHFFWSGRWFRNLRDSKPKVPQSPNSPIPYHICHISCPNSSISHQNNVFRIYVQAASAPSIIGNLPLQMTANVVRWGINRDQEFSLQTQSMTLYVHTHRDILETCAVAHTTTFVLSAEH